jgi:hypothetical protein
MPKEATAPALITTRWGFTATKTIPPPSLTLMAFFKYLDGTKVNLGYPSREHAVLLTFAMRNGTPIFPAATSPHATATSSWLEEQVGMGVDADAVVDESGEAETKMPEKKTTPALAWPSRFKSAMIRVILQLPPHSDFGLRNLDDT